MSQPADDTATLEQDAELDEPLRRVAYEAGMLLGLEATRQEQAYHRRRLTRHQYWLHGAGTLAGMAVGLETVAGATPEEPARVRVIVGPGIGIDNLGREVLVHESYCIDLGDWLEARGADGLREGYDDAADLLWLKVTVRYEECPVAAQPVLARKLNLGTDPVQPSRTSDGVLLELNPELPPAADTRYRPWGVHPPLGDAMPALTAAEQVLIDAASGAEAEQLRLHARLLHALDVSGVGAAIPEDRREEHARLLLARISLAVTDIDAISVDPAQISVNNLVRPFLSSAGQLAYLARQA
jgi:hypothetical protein